MSMYDQKREEIFHVAGDVPDPGAGARGVRDDARGELSTVNLQASRTAEVQIRYKDFIIYGDVYQFPDAPLKVVIMCPQCRNTLNISADQKQMEYDFAAAPSIGGKISIEPFGCTWEKPDAGAHNKREGSIHLITGMKMCGWKVGVSNNVARDAR